MEGPPFLSEKPEAQHFMLGPELGNGNFSAVHRAIHKASRRVYAVKVVNKFKVERMKRRHPNIQNELLMERAVLLRCRHPNVVRLYNTCQDGGHLYFVMEHVGTGELFDRLVDPRLNRPVGIRHPSLAPYYVAQLVRALAYLHSSGIVHRDVKPENVLVSRSGRCVLVDFGTAKDLVDGSLNGPEFVGTPEYMAPEVISNQGAGPAADLWALGCLIYQLHTGASPFGAGSPYLAFTTVQGAHLDLAPHLPVVVVDLVSRLLRQHPATRLGVGSEASGYSAILGHPYFAGVDVDSFPVEFEPEPPLVPRDLDAGAEPSKAAAAAAGPLPSDNPFVEVVDTTPAISYTKGAAGGARGGAGGGSDGQSEEVKDARVGGEEANDGRVGARDSREESKDGGEEATRAWVVQPVVDLERDVHGRAWPPPPVPSLRELAAAAVADALADLSWRPRVRGRRGGVDQAGESKRDGGSRAGGAVPGEVPAPAPAPAPPSWATRERLAPLRDRPLLRPVLLRLHCLGRLAHNRVHQLLHASAAKARRALLQSPWPLDAPAIAGCRFREGRLWTRPVRLAFLGGPAVRVERMDCPGSEQLQQLLLAPDDVRRVREALERVACTRPRPKALVVSGPLLDPAALGSGPERQRLVRNVVELLGELDQRIVLVRAKGWGAWDALTRAHDSRR